MTPEPSERCSRGPPNCGPPKKRRKNGSSISGLRFSTVFAAETVTTAGVTRCTIGAYDIRSASGDGGTTRCWASAAGGERQRQHESGKRAEAIRHGE